MSNPIHKIKKARDIAFDLGLEAGKNAAEWSAMDLFGGRQTNPKAARDNAKSVIDAEFLDGVPNLSGEWANSQTPTSLAREVLDQIHVNPDRLSDDDFSDYLEEVSESWEMGASEGYFNELTRLAKDFLA
ncbi:hypothetical protein UFOVP510_33 [uncultured Caudovirales phage]|uniref:Uncharacterized protein n=1 Tax=uncultured Caudovirales phage TaxID=2100421 RepID=A0A6J5MME7_9CAUD|nr:hypothetical protein UFOVP510_33 [uncultured Caudovirales phage]